jgi:hypothetical protein
VKQYNPHQYQQFTDKIFDVEFALPIYEPSVIASRVKKLLFDKIDQKFHAELSMIIDQTEEDAPSFTQRLLHTYRDAIRFCNSFLFDIDIVKEEVSMRDFYLLQLLKLKFKRVFDALATGKFRFFVYASDKTNMEVLQFRQQADLGKAASTIAVEQYLEKNPVRK